MTASVDPFALTGRAGGPPLLPPAGMRDRIDQLGGSLGIDPWPLLADRAAAAGWARRGAVSCGGRARLVGAVDGWLAVSLARDDDESAVPAWLEVEPAESDPWRSVEAAVRARASAPLVARAGLLDLPIAAVGSVPPPRPDDALDLLPVRHRRWSGGGPLDGTLDVVDLSALWAGPLCSRLLADRGARVVEVDSAGRPDPGRRWPAGFAERLHAGKASVAVDLRDPAARDRLGTRAAAADVVITSSRRRALAGLGLDRHEATRSAAGPKVWVSITGYGYDDDRVAFGDDAAAAGGLVAWDDHGPCFAFDAVADPLSGMVAAAAVTAAVRRPGRWWIDVGLATVAAFVAGADRDRPWTARAEVAGGDRRDEPAVDEGGH